MENQTWHKLDNSAKIYPLMLNNKHQNLFRISAEMRDKVDPKILAQALQDTLLRFPLFNVALKKGFFWHYLEASIGEAHHPPRKRYIFK